MTTPIAALPLVHDAVLAKLTGDTDLADTISGVFDNVPEDTPYPYVVLGEGIETPDNRHGGYGRHTVLTLHVWSQHFGFHPALAIANRVTALLDHQPLTITGLRHVATRFESLQTLTDPEPPGNIRHVPMRFRVVTEQP